MKKVLRILGTRGVPAAHGGFETFAHYLSLHLVSKGWRVVVYCQEDGVGPIRSDVWQGVERVIIPVSQGGSLGTVVFDWRAILHAAKFRDLCLTLGYNTAFFCLVLKLKGIRNVINMDGIEWARQKWGRVAKLWFWLNDWAGCWLGDVLVADHPEIEKHLMTRRSGKRVVMIPYGSEFVSRECANASVLANFGLSPGMYWTVIARPEPENSLLEIVKGFSSRHRGVFLVVLGNYSDGNEYHRAVIDAASDEVKFVGAIYDKEVVQALRVFGIGYVHGHQVGGTNPSLVEALGSGNAVIAHDNKFNRWVVGEGALYFDGADSFSDCMDKISHSPELLSELRSVVNDRFHASFTWLNILSQYEKVLDEYA